MIHLNAFRSRAAAWTVVLAAACPWAAEAALFRAYLSVEGNDANDCSLTAPCRLLPAALAAVNDGGEIWMLDSGNFNTSTVTVAKSVTILAIPGAQGSLVATAAARAVHVNGAGIRVALRNIGLRDVNSNGSFGVFFAQGASLLLDQCRFANLQGGGLAALATNGRVVVRDSVFRQNGGIAIELSGNVDVLVDGTEIVQSASNGIRLQGEVKLHVRGSVITGSGSSGILAQNFGPGTIQVLIDRSTLSGNFSPGFYASASATGGVVQATVTRSTFSGNGTAGIASNATTGTATVVIDGNTFAQQPRGVLLNGGAVRTRQNNVFNYHTNVPGDVDGGALTPHPGL